MNCSRKWEQDLEESVGGKRSSSSVVLTRAKRDFLPLCVGSNSLSLW